MAEFQGGGAGARNDPAITGKWKPGGRGRPPRNPPAATLPVNSGEINGNSSTGAAGNSDDDGAEVNYPEMFEHGDMPAEPLPGNRPGPTSVRAHSDTYPRNTTGMPIPPHRVIKTEIEFQRYVDAMRPDDWAHAVMYCYQKRPMVKVTPGTPQYLDKVGAGPFDLERFIRTNGSGLYHFCLNDTNLPGNKTTVMYAQLELEREAFPERWHLDTLDVYHKNNVQLVARLKRDGLLDDKGNPAMAQDNATTAQTVQQLTGALIDFAKQGNRQQAPDGNAALQTTMMTETVKMMANASKSTLDAALAQVKSQDPAAFLSMIAQLKDMFQPQRPAEDNGMLKMLLDELKASRLAEADARKEAAAERQRQHDLQLAALNNKAAAADPLAQFKQLLEIKSLITGGAETMAPKNWKEMAVSMFQENAPQLIGLGTAIFSSMGKPNPVTAEQMQANAAAVGAAGGMHPQPIAQPHPQPIDTTSPRPGQVDSGAGAANPTPTNAEQIAVQRIEALQGQLQQYGQFLINAITAGGDGYKFAESMITMAGELTYARAAAFTVDEWMIAVFSFPQMAQTFSGVEGRVKQFITEFLEYDAAEEGTDDGDPELETVTVNPPPPAPPPVRVPATPRKPRATATATATTKGTK